MPIKYVTKTLEIQPSPGVLHRHSQMAKQIGGTTQACVVWLTICIGCEDLVIPSAGHTPTGS